MTSQSDDLLKVGLFTPESIDETIKFLKIFEGQEKEMVDLKANFHGFAIQKCLKMINNYSVFAMIWKVKDYIKQSSVSKIIIQC